MGIVLYAKRKNNGVVSNMFETYPKGALQYIVVRLATPLSNKDKKAPEQLEL